MTDEKSCRKADEDERLYWTLSPLEDAEGHLIGGMRCAICGRIERRAKGLRCKNGCRWERLDRWGYGVPDEKTRKRWDAEWEAALDEVQKNIDADREHKILAVADDPPLGMVS